jgi:hypothetical protein
MNKIDWNTVAYLRRGAKRSGDSLYLWIRYLNKFINNDTIQISDQTVAELMKSDDLMAFQKAWLQLSVQENSGPYTVTNNYSN